MKSISANKINVSIHCQSAEKEESILASQCEADTRASFMDTGNSSDSSDSSDSPDSSSQTLHYSYEDAKKSQTDESESEAEVQKDVKVKEMDRASNTPRGVMYIERDHAVPQRVRFDESTHAIKRQRVTSTEYAIAPRRLDEVKMLGVQRTTVDVFRDLPPSHIGGLLLNKLSVVDERGFCEHCGVAGHVSAVCREPSTCVKVIYSNGTPSGSGASVVAIVLGCRSQRHTIGECPYTSCTLCSGQHSRTSCRLFQEPRPDRERSWSGRGGRGKGSRGKKGGGRGNRGKSNGGRGGSKGKGRGNYSAASYHPPQENTFQEQATFYPSSPTYVYSSPSSTAQMLPVDDCISAT